ncbi:hypothetical protein A5839_000677, partial [Enterococcus faecium]
IHINRMLRKKREIITGLCTINCFAVGYLYPFFSCM